MLTPSSRYAGSTVSPTVDPSLSLLMPSVRTPSLANLPRATASSDNEAEAEASSEGDEAYWSEEDVRGAMLSRFDSSTVRMLDDQTLVVTGPDGKKDYFVKQKQMGIKSG